jgi:alcohol dehydrogenase (cytochrome c)
MGEGICVQYFFDRIGRVVMNLITRNLCCWVLVILACHWSVAVDAQQRPEKPAEFTQEQAVAGRTAFREHCAECYGADLTGSDVGAPLTGTRFDYSWRGKPAGALAFHVRRMPPKAVAEPGSVSAEAHTNILAYLLRMNGMEPGDVALPSDMEALGTLTIPKLPGMDHDPYVPVTKTEKQTALLDNLASVTEDILLNPSPSDWVHWGGSYDMHNFSRLDEINKENVSGLKPAFRVPLREGRNNPAPLVHQGVMYLYAAPETLLAMDATNGDILWRHKHESTGRVGNHMGLRFMGIACISRLPICTFLR